jgi:hypothetical protein
MRAGVYDRLVGVSIRLLGPVGARDGQRAIALGPRKQRLVFAVLVLEAGRTVDVARLVDLAWPQEPPRTAQHAIQVCVSGLRSALRGTDGLGRAGARRARVDLAGPRAARRRTGIRRGGPRRAPGDRPRARTSRSGRLLELLGG